MRTILTALCLAMAAGAAQADGTIAWTLDGFAMPESVAADPSSGMLYVSNMGTDPMKKDGDGRIARITADGQLDMADWATGLDAPKGMDVVDGKLYVADIDQLVEIDTANGQVTNRYAVEGAQFLNDVAAAPDGRVFVSDTFGSAVYVLDAGEISLFAQDAGMLSGANGLIVMDGALLVADLGDLSGGFANITPGPVVRVDLATKAITLFGAEGPVGVLDGIESDGAGGVLLTDNAAGKLLDLKPGGTATELATVGSGAADLEVLPEQGLAVIPITGANQVVAVRLN
jgi:DNA-binding beta-propeller fold protein YncE